MKKKAELPKSRISPNLGRLPDCNVFTAEEFKDLVKYERARSDRSGSTFSITVFHLGYQYRICPGVAVTRISQYSRSVDCVCVGDDGKIAVLLPDTIKEGAETFGRKVLDELEKLQEDHVKFEVYSYPHKLEFSAPLDSPTPKKSEGGQGLGEESVESFYVDGIPGWKRALDISVAALMLLATSPLFLILIVYIKLVSPGPAFFKQTRVGYKGIPFAFWKFRTMKCGNDQSFHGEHAKGFIRDGDKPMDKLDSYDPRIIPGGRAIRKSCMDELPQLWNVLKGEMSLVGPRPCIPYEAQEYLRWHTHRFDVLPGMSGLWQVSGKNKLSFKQMVRLDIEYCNDMSLWGDLLILLKTPGAIAKMVLESVAKRLPWAGSRPRQGRRARRSLQFLR